MKVTNGIIHLDRAPHNQHSTNLDQSVGSVSMSDPSHSPLRPVHPLSPVSPFHPPSLVFFFRSVCIPILTSIHRPVAATKEDIKCTTAAMESLQREHEMLRTLARAGALSAGGKDRAVKEYFRDQQGIRHKLEQVLAASGAGGDISGVTSPRSEGTVDGDGAMPPLLRVKELAAELGLSADLTKRLLEKA